MSIYEAHFVTLSPLSTHPLSPYDVNVWGWLCASPLVAAPSLCVLYGTHFLPPLTGAPSLSLLCQYMGLTLCLPLPLVIAPSFSLLYQCMRMTLHLPPSLMWLSKATALCPLFPLCTRLYTELCLCASLEEKVKEVYMSILHVKLASRLLKLFKASACLQGMLAWLMTNSRWLKGHFRTYLVFKS